LAAQRSGLLRTAVVVLASLTAKRTRAAPLRKVTTRSSTPPSTRHRAVPRRSSYRGSHRVTDDNINGGPGNESELEFLVRVESWYNEKTAELIRSLKDATDIYGGNLLDNTIVPYVTEVGRATHRLHDIPVVLFGGKNLGMQGGQFIHFERQRMHNDMWITVAGALGVSMDALRGERGVMYDASTYHGPIEGVLG
jgi:hypothetical protein